MSRLQGNPLFTSLPVSHFPLLVSLITILLLSATFATTRKETTVDTFLKETSALANLADTIEMRSPAKAYALMKKVQFLTATFIDDNPSSSVRKISWTGP